MEVVQIIRPEVLEVMPQAQFERNFQRIDKISVSQIGKEMGDVMQITLLEVLKVVTKLLFLSLSLCEALTHSYLRVEERVFKRMLMPFTESPVPQTREDINEEVRGILLKASNISWLGLGKRSWR